MKLQCYRMEVASNITPPFLFLISILLHTLLLLLVRLFFCSMQPELLLCIFNEFEYIFIVVCTNKIACRLHGMYNLVEPRRARHIAVVRPEIRFTNGIQTALLKMPLYQINNPIEFSVSARGTPKRLRLIRVTRCLFIDY